MVVAAARDVAAAGGGGGKEVAAAKWAVCVACESLRFGGDTAATSGPDAAKTRTAITEKRKRPPIARRTADIVPTQRRSDARVSVT